jgi:hypothetical protein
MGKVGSGRTRDYSRKRPANRFPDGNQLLRNIALLPTQERQGEPTSPSSKESAQIAEKL